MAVASAASLFKRGAVQGTTGGSSPFRGLASAVGSLDGEVVDVGEIEAGDTVISQPVGIAGGDVGVGSEGAGDKVFLTNMKTDEF